MQHEVSRSVRLNLFALFALAICALFASAPANAVPVDVYFDGNTTAAFPNTNFGLSAAQATDLEMNYGVPIVTQYDFLGSASGVLGITQSLQSFNPSPPTSSDNTAVSNWDVQNVLGSDLIGATYLVFTSSSPFVVDGTTIDYLDSNVGLTIDAALGWALIESTNSDGTFYYPAIALDRSVANPIAGSFLDGQIEQVVVNYRVLEALVDAPGGSVVYELPLLNVGVAFAAVPEPGTGLLVSIGLIGLALRRRSHETRAQARRDHGLPR